MNAVAAALAGDDLGGIRRIEQQPSIVDEVARQLRESIVVGLIPAGSRLPVPEELAKQAGVGVITMRTALGQLRDEGLIRTQRGRNGGSTVVSDEEIVAVCARKSVYARQELWEKMEILLALEAHAIGLAALQATDGERTEIRRLGAAPTAAPTFRDQQLACHAFNLAVAHASHNRELALLIQRYRARVQEMRTAGQGSALFCVNLGTYYADVVGLIEAGDAEGAKRRCSEFLAACWTCVFDMRDRAGLPAGVRATPVPSGIGMRRYAPALSLAR